MLIEAAKCGLSKILITCNEPNIASAKVIEKNGGVLEKIIPSHISTGSGYSFLNFFDT